MEDSVRAQCAVSTMAQTGQDLGEGGGLGIRFSREEMRAYFIAGFEGVYFCAGCVDCAGAVGGGDYWLFEGETKQCLWPGTVLLVLI